MNIAQVSPTNAPQCFFSLSFSFFSICFVSTPQFFVQPLWICVYIIHNLTMQIGWRANWTRQVQQKMQVIVTIFSDTNHQFKWYGWDDERMRVLTAHHFFFSSFIFMSEFALNFDSIWWWSGASGLKIAKQISTLHQYGIIFDIGKFACAQFIQSINLFTELFEGERHMCQSLEVSTSIFVFSQFNCSIDKDDDDDDEDDDDDSGG